MVVKFKVFKEYNNDSRPAQNTTMGETEFNLLMWLKDQLFIASEKVGIEKKFSPLVIPTKSKDEDDQLKLAQIRLMEWTEQTKKIVWLSCGTTRMSQRVQMLKSDYLKGRRTASSFDKLFTWTLKLKSFSIYLI